MAIRIYSLAKELKIDNKKLVDICTKAGIKGKGSALASLTDEELATVKAFMAGGPRGARPETAPPPVAAAAAGVAAAPVRHSDQPIPSGVTQGFRREDYIAPGGMSGGRVPMLPPRADKSAAAKKKAEEGTSAQPPEKEKSAPAIHLAPLPTAQQPVAKAKAKEPEPQKPDIKLPADAIRASRAGGSKPLSEHLRKHEEKKAKDEAAAKRTSPRKSAGPVEPAPPPPSGPSGRCGSGPLGRSR